MATVSLFDSSDEIARGYFQWGPYHVDEAFKGNFAAVFSAAMCLERGVSGDIRIPYACSPSLLRLLERAARQAVKGVSYTFYPKDEVERDLTTGSGLVVSFSGGMDSTTALFSALELGNTVHAISFDTGQVPFNGGVWSENAAVHRLSEYATKMYVDRFRHTMEVDCKIVKKPQGRPLWLKAFRNPMLLMTALTWEESVRAVTLSGQRGDRIMDNDPLFVRRFSEAVGINIYMPNIQLYSCDEIAYMLDLQHRSGYPIYPSTYSCQIGKRVGPEYFCCGACTSCLQRAMGMVLLNIDPLVNGGKPLPTGVDAWQYYKFDWLRGKPLRTFIQMAKTDDQKVPFQAMIMKLAQANVEELGGLYHFLPAKQELRDQLTIFWRLYEEGYYKRIARIGDFGIIDDPIHYRQAQRSK